MKTENTTTQEEPEEFLKVSASDLQILVGDQSSYQDFCNIEITHILCRAGIRHYRYEPSKSGQRYFSLELAHIIVSNKTGFTCTMATILFEEAMAGMHSSASLTAQINALIDMNHGSKLQVDTRALHRFLGVKQPFSLWITQEIKNLKLMKNRDYSRVPREIQENKKPSLLPRYRWEVSVTAEIAMDMAMTARSPRGQQLRCYFIKLSDLLEPDPFKSWDQIMKAMTGGVQNPATSL